MARKLGDWLTSYLDFVENSEPPEMFKLWCVIASATNAPEKASGRASMIVAGVTNDS